jgi:hypothetical protein
MISRTESLLEMILLLKGLAKATVTAAIKVEAMRHRAARIFIIQQINTFFVSATEIRSGTRPQFFEDRFPRGALPSAPVFARDIEKAR